MKHLFSRFNIRRARKGQNVEPKYPKEMKEVRGQNPNYELHVEGHRYYHSYVKRKRFDSILKEGGSSIIEQLNESPVLRLTL